jgi:DUF4097 and DUF4098 domain-containing protein YvlB
MQMPEVHEYVTHIKTDNEMRLEVGGKLVKEVVKLKSRDEEIAMGIRDARAYLESCMNTMRKEWFDWQETADSSVKELRQFRMALTSESKQIAEACKDVRGFLMSDAHTEEMRRLQEFVALCERLRDLKKDGTLGYVVDAILKIECK